MELIKFTEKEYSLNDGKKIVCYEKSLSYLNELKEKFPGIEKRIICVVEKNNRYQTDIKIGDINISVEPMEFLGKVDFSDTILLITSDYFMEAYEQIKFFADQSGNNSQNPERVFYFPNCETEIDLRYRERYRNTPLSNMILFRSGPHSSSCVRGTDFSDNARALFEYMLRNGYNEKYRLVWLVKNPENFSKYGIYKNVSFISFDWSTSENVCKREKYYEALCLSKWIFMTDAYGFCRNARKDQMRIQLWHGCGFKTRTNFVPCANRYEYKIVTSEKYREIHADIFGLRDDQVIITGCPKTDWLFEKTDFRTMEKLGIRKTGKMIFWLPTFRMAKNNLKELNENTLVSETGLPIITNKEYLIEINKFLEDRDVILVIKLHPFQDRDSIICEKRSNIILLDNEQLVDLDLQINQILPFADALISDYSSAAVDYLLLNRPIAFTLDDVKEFEDSRGFVFDNIREWLPGKEVSCVNEFIEYIDEISKDIDSTAEKRNHIRDIMHKFKEGGSCKRVLDAFGI